MEHLYVATCPPGEEALRDFEMRGFGLAPTRDPRLWLGKEPLRIETSAFIVLHLVRPLCARTFAGLMRQVRRRPDDAPSYRMEIWPEKKGRRRLLRRLAEVLGPRLWGDADPRRGEERIAWVRGRGVQFLGTVGASVKNRFAALEDRPYRNSQSLPDRLARVAINSAPGGGTLWDPLTGTGTLLLHAALLGRRMIGSDKNRKLCHMARANLAALGAAGAVVQADAGEPCAAVDCIVTDFPYRLMTHWAEGEEERILTALRDVARAFVLIHGVPLGPLLTRLGFTIEREGVFRKGQVRRHLFVCRRAASSR